MIYLMICDPYINDDIIVTTDHPLLKYPHDWTIPFFSDLRRAKPQSVSAAVSPDHPRSAGYAGRGHMQVKLGPQPAWPRRASFSPTRSWIS